MLMSCVYGYHAVYYSGAYLQKAAITSEANLSVITVSGANLFSLLYTPHDTLQKIFCLLLLCSLTQHKGCGCDHFPGSCTQIQLLCLEVIVP